MYRLPTSLNRVAIITDIHGNLPALEASLEAVEEIGVDGGSSAPGSAAVIRRPSP
jgi:hypothetical protein